MTVKTSTSTKFVNRDKNPIQPVTGQKIGNDKIGMDVLPKALFPIQLLPFNPDANSTKTILESAAASAVAKEGDVIRFTSGNCLGAEASVLEIVGNSIFLGMELPQIPLVGDEFLVMRHITLTLDQNGALSTSSGPVQYILDGSAQQVIEDTVDPTNNRVLPTAPFVLIDGVVTPLSIDTANYANSAVSPNLMYYLKDGVLSPINRDTVTPANTRPIPVELVDITGVPVNLNLTTGDLSIEMSHDGVTHTWDSTRIGDGLNLLRIKPDVGDAGFGEATVHDKDNLAKLEEIRVLLNSIDTSTGAGATEATLDLVRVAVQSIAGEDFATEATLDLVRLAVQSIAGEDFATEATLDLVRTAVQSIAGEDFATETTLDLVRTAVQSIAGEDFATETTLDAVKTNTLSSANDLGLINGKVATETTLAAMSAKLPPALGIQTVANSFSVVLATIPRVQTAVKNIGVYGFINSVTVSDSAYTELIADTGAVQLTAVRVEIRAAGPYLLAVGGVGSEVDKFIMSDNGIYDLVIPANSRLSVKGLLGSVPNSTIFINGLYEVLL